MNKIRKYKEETKEKQKEEFLKSLDDDERFSVTFDEWTSKRGRKHMNVNIHNSKGPTVNLGLIRVWGGQKSETLLKLLEEKLKEFGIDIERIISITTDAARIIVKLGRIVSATHQLCLAHAIHLAVGHLLYEKKKKSKKEKKSGKTQRDHLNDSSSDGETSADLASLESPADSDFSDEDEGSPPVENQESNADESGGDVIDEIDYDEGLRVISTNEPTNEVPQLAAQYREVVKKVRDISKKFGGKSTVLKDELAKLFKAAALGKKESLKMDVATRWNTLVDMLHRYYIAHEPVDARLNLLEYNKEKMISDSDLATVKLLVEALLPVKQVAEKLCKHDMTILKADVAMGFLLDKLSLKIANPLAILLADSLKRYYLKRRNTEILQLMAYLDDDPTKRYVSKTCHIPAGIHIHKRVPLCSNIYLGFLHMGMGA